MRTFRKGEMAGAAELKAALDGLGTELSTKIGQTAVRDTAKAFQTALVDAAPRGPGRDKSWGTKGGKVSRRNYGHLFENIKVRKEKARQQHHVTYRVSTTNAFWGWFLEKGTVKMRARPWFRPVLDAMQDRLMNAMIENVWAGIGKTTKRLARLGKR